VTPRNMPGEDAEQNAIADALLDYADDIAALSPRPMTRSNLDANVRYMIAHLAVCAIRGETPWVPAPREVHP